MNIGFLGTGAITSAVVRGLCAAQAAGSTAVRIKLSPRNAERAARLAEEFDQVSIADENQAVVDASDVVFLAVRPNIVDDVLGAVRFREDQKIVSMVSTLGAEAIARLVAPARSTARVMPLPPCARRRGVVVAFGADAATMDLLRGLGEVLPVATERELNVLMAVTALISPIYTVLAGAADWASARGVENILAERYVASMTAAISEDRLQEGSGSLLELASEAATPGGLNEGARTHIDSAGGFESFASALDETLERIEGLARGG